MALPSLEIHRELDHARVLLAVRGEIDLATVSALREALGDAASQTGDVWVDLTEVEFMDSTGLTALVAGHHVIGDDGRQLRIICPGGGLVRRALEVSGLDEVLNVYDDRAAAAA
jgi:anti-sigma B factor antagonist